MFQERNLIIVTALVLLALFFVSAAHSKGDPELVYSYKDDNGQIIFTKDACPFIDPKEKIAPYFYFGMMVMVNGQLPMCWARQVGGKVLVMFQDPRTGELMQMIGEESVLTREGAPLPKAMGETGV